MVKMVSLARTADEKKADMGAMPGRAEMSEPEGLEVHLTHEHLQKLGLKEPLPTGSEMTLQGKGKVTSSHSEEINGEMRHRMAVRLDKAGVEPTEDPNKRDGGLREELSDAAGKSEQKASERAAQKTAKKEGNGKAATPSDDGTY